MTQAQTIAGPPTATEALRCLVKITMRNDSRHQFEVRLQNCYPFESLPTLVKEASNEWWATLISFSDKRDEAVYVVVVPSRDVATAMEDPAR